MSIYFWDRFLVLFQGLEPLVCFINFFLWNSVNQIQNLTMTDSITTNIIGNFEHELTAELRRQSCQGIHSAYSVLSIASFMLLYLPLIF